MRKTLLSALIDSVCVVLLSICPLICFASSFSVNYTLSILVISAFMFSAVFSLIAEFIQSKRQYALSMAVIAFVILLIAAFANGVLLSQANYAINKVLEQYSIYLPVMNRIKFAESIANDATGLFVLISAVFSGLFSFLISKLKSIKIVTMLTILFLVPCFVLVNTLPSVAPLLTIFVVLFALYFSSQTRHLNYSHSGAVTATAAVLLTVVISIAAALNPVADYKRTEWQDNLLATVQQITGLKNYGDKNSVTAALAEVGNSLDSEVDFSNAGALKQTGKKVMTVNSNTSGTLYLKGMAYANYENNKWSVLTDEQAENFPTEVQPFLLTGGDVGTIDIKIHTEKAEGVVYTPYFLSEINSDFSGVCDVFVKNGEKAKDYSLKTIPYYNNQEYYLKGEMSLSLQYYSYVNDNYLQLPEETKLAMLDIAEKNNLTDVSYEALPQVVKSFVSSSASYSLNTPKVPEGRDAAEWFLNDSDTGYCMHFANSAAVMLRALGVPARYVTGYCINVVDGKAIVTSDNAHAWVEYFDQNIGWVLLDATSSDFTIPQATEAVQATTQSAPTTAPAVTQPNTQSATSPQKKQNNANGFNNALIPIILLIVAAAVILRVIILRLYRKYSFTHNDNKSRAICIYRYLNKLSVHSGCKLHKSIERICTKARFGNRSISDKEYKDILMYVPIFRRKVFKNINVLKKLYFIIILGL